MSDTPRLLCTVIRNGSLCGRLREKRSDKTDSYLSTCGACRRDPDKVKKYQRDYYHRNKAKRLSNYDKWYQSNRAYVNEYRRLKYANDAAHRRRVKDRSNARRWVNKSALIEIITVRDEYLCHLCHDEFSVEEIPHLDHIIPVVVCDRNGWPVEYRDSVHNLALAHESCNLSRGSKLLSEVIQHA